MPDDLGFSYADVFCIDLVPIKSVGKIGLRECSALSKNAKLTVKDLKENFLIHGDCDIRLVFGVSLSNGSLSVLEVDVVLALL